MNRTTRRDWIATYDPDDPELRAAVRRRETRFMLWCLLPTFVLLLLSARAGLVYSDQYGPIGPDRLVTRAPEWLAMVTLVAAAVLLVASFGIVVRRAQQAFVRGNPRALLTRAENWRVGQQIRGREPVASHEVPFLRDVARAVYVQRWAAVPMAGVALLVVTATILGEDDGATVPSFLAIVPIAIGALSLRAARHAQRFLASVETPPE
jgi:hypothetical protein